MKNKTKFLTAIMAIGIALAISSCQKGAAGPAGTNGTNGVANISSNVYSITPGSWSNPSTGVYAVNITDASISSANTDGIEVFISTNGTLWLGLPSTNLLVNGDQMEFDYQNGQVGLLYLNSSAPTSTVNLKVVVIPPAVMKQNPNTDWHNYNQVQAIMDAQNTSSK